VGTIYTLHANTTILACQTLLIPAGYVLVVPSGFTLTNYGRINNKGTITNNGTITNVSSSSPYVFGGIIYNNGGTIKNEGTFINGNPLLPGGIIYNYNNANGSSTCGTGILNGSLPPTATGTSCPP
jgi:hypothetical protein